MIGAMINARSSRLDELPAYIFAEIHRKRRAAIDAGRDLIDFGVGDPDRPTHDYIMTRMQQALLKPENHLYGLGGGIPEFRQSVAAFFQQRYGVEIDPQKELLALIGSKEGLGHLPQAVVSPGRTVIVPSPGYPAYYATVVFAGAKPWILGLRAEDGWLPDFDAIPADVARDATLMYINYPNNPTGALAEIEVFERAVEFGRKHDILIAQDAAYNELYLGDRRPPSILQVPGAREVAIEFHSASKTFNMSGWRIGFVVGNAGAIAALAAVKANYDSGAFKAVQEAACTAYDGIDGPELVQMRALYRKRGVLLCSGLRPLGFQAEPPEATFYIWAGVPAGIDSLTACDRLLDEADIVGVPGIGFGPTAEGFIRFSLGVPEERIALAVERMGRLKW